MSIHKLLFVGLFLLAVQAVNASDVHLSRDTLYCNLESTDVGTLKERASQISDLNVIKTMVLAGYIAQSDEDFIHTLGKKYSLHNLDMTELRSTMSSQGLEGCTSLESVKYSRYWTETGHYLFLNCTNLKEVIFPDDSECSLTSFSSGTFRGCTSLETISIPASVTYLNTQVFYLCNNLKEIHCQSGVAPIATVDTYDSQFESTIIYVPTGAISNYKTTSGWCMFSNYKEDPKLSYIGKSDLKSDNVSLTNDTLYCNLTSDEVGNLRDYVLGRASDLGSIKHAVLSGYLSDADFSFLAALASAYQLSSLDMTNLQSTYSYRFQGCSQLKEVKYSRYWNSTGFYLFELCANITKVEFPTNIIGGGYLKLDGGTFRGCTSLEKIRIPSTVQSLGSQCFYLCSNLKTIQLDAVVPPSATEDSFGDQFSSARLIVPKGTLADYKTAAGWSLFKNIEESTEDVDLAKQEISDNVSFSDGTLYVNLPAEEVGRLRATVLNKFPDLERIHTVVVSNYMNQEDAGFLNALASAYNLSTIDFTELKNSLGNYAFQGCRKLSKVYYSRYWSSSGWYLFCDCSSLAEVVFPSEPVDQGITSFESGTFRGCLTLEDISIPKNVTRISTQCFYLCQNLRNVTFLGSAITDLDKGAFEGCNSLETITLPSSMSLIGERCFENCPKIREIHCDAITPPQVSESAFEDIYQSATLYVPKGSRSKYAEASVWKNFSNIEESEASGISNIDAAVQTGLVSIYTLDGTPIYRGTTSVNVHQVLSKGTYIVKQGSGTKKIIVK